VCGHFAYFLGVSNSPRPTKATIEPYPIETPPEKCSETTQHQSGEEASPMKKIEAIIKPFKLDEVKEALQDAMSLISCPR
jgi:hypothetical protein